MAGDNLSVISDTTIAATRTQGCEMRDKFRENLKIALPAALATAVLLGFPGDAAPVEAPDAASKWLVVPSLAVLVLAFSGLNVGVVAGMGIGIAGVVAFVLVPGSDSQVFVGDCSRGC